MKTTTINSLKKRIQKANINKTTIVYGWVNEILTGKKEFRPVYSQGSSWKHSTLFDRTREFSATLDILKLEYKIINDAPRGGKTGVKLTIITKIK